METESIRALLDGLPFKTWGEIDELNEIVDKPNVALPGLYIVDDAEQGLPPPEGSYVLHQVINATVSIVIVMNAQAAQKGAIKVRLRALGKMVTERLFGAQPDGWDSALTFGDMRTVRLSPALIARVIRFRGRTHLRKTQQTP